MVAMAGSAADNGQASRRNPRQTDDQRGVSFMKRYGAVRALGWRGAQSGRRPVQGEGSERPRRRPRDSFLQQLDLGDRRSVGGVEDVQMELAGRTQKRDAH
jgi:hypothetical protein